MRPDVDAGMIKAYAELKDGVDTCTIKSLAGGINIRLVGPAHWGEFVVYHDELNRSEDPMALCIEAVDTIHMRHFMDTEGHG